MNINQAGVVEANLKTLQQHNINFADTDSPQMVQVGFMSSEYVPLTLRN